MLKDFQYKLSFLAKNMAPALLQTMHAGVVEFFSKPNKESHISPACIESLSLNLGYCLIRNRNWTHDNLCAEIILEFLTSQYFLTKDTAAGLLKHLLNKLSPYVGQSTASSKDFKRFLLVYCLTADDEHSLLRQFGFGSAIFERLKGVATLMDESQRGIIHFPNALQAEFVQLIIELSEEKASCPWIEQIYKLQYALADGSEAYASVLRQWDMQQIFSLLITIGENREIVSTPKNASLLQFLNARDLIYPLSKKQWHLSPTALALTAPAQAQRLLAKGTIVPEVFTKLAPEYQIAVLKFLHNEKPAAAQQLFLQGLKNFAPKVIEFGTKNIFVSGGAYDAIENLLLNGTSIWQKKAICQALSGVASVDARVRQILEKLAQSETSEGVREEALKGIITAHDTV